MSKFVGQIDRSDPSPETRTSPRLNSSKPKVKEDIDANKPPDTQTGPPLGYGSVPIMAELDWPVRLAFGRGLLISAENAE